MVVERLVEVLAGVDAVAGVVEVLIVTGVEVTDIPVGCPEVGSNVTVVT